eukprot:920731_1
MSNEIHNNSKSKFQIFVRIVVAQRFKTFGIMVDDDTLVDDVASELATKTDVVPHFITLSYRSRILHHNKKINEYHISRESTLNASMRCMDSDSNQHSSAAFPDSSNNERAVTHKYFAVSGSKSFEKHVEKLVYVLSLNHDESVIWSKTNRTMGRYQVVISEAGCRDMKVFMVLARGGSVVSKKWLVDSIARKMWLPHSDYSDYFPKWDTSIDDGLLKHFSVYIQETKNIPEFLSSQMKQIARTLGAKVVSQIDHFRSNQHSRKRNAIISHPDSDTSYLNTENATIVKMKWLTDCVERAEALPLKAYKIRSSKIFNGYTFALHGRLSMKQSDLEAIIKTKGGTVSKYSLRHTDFVVHQPIVVESAQQILGKLVEAQKYSIPCLEEQYIHDSVTQNRLLHGSAYQNVFLCRKPQKCTLIFDTKEAAMTHRKHCISGFMEDESDEIDTSDSDYMPFDGAHQSTVSRKIQPSSRRRKYSDSSSSYFSDSSSSSDDDSSPEGDDRIYKLRVPRSAWVFYNTQKTAQLLDTHPDAGIGERTKMSAKVWNTLDEDERDQWEEMAAAEQLQYEECRKLLEKNGTFDEIPSSWKRINRKAEAERRGKVTTKHKKGKKKKKKTKKPTKKKDKKKKKKKKKEGDDRIYKLRVPRSAWVFYNTQKISQLLDTHPDAGIGERTKMSAKVWNT